MKNKKSINILILVVSMLLVAFSIIFMGSDSKFQGICLGIGAGLFGMSIANLYMNHFENKNPEYMKQNEIELKDERNTLIRYRAKAKAGDVIQWFIMAIAYITIIINSPLWVTLVIVGVFLLYNFLTLYLMTKYEKEM